MLGLNSNSPATDDTVTLNDYYGSDYGQDVINGVIHELSEGAMGRVGGLGDQNGIVSTMDLFRYTASGVPDYSDGRDGVTTYFSSNGGVTTSASAGLSFHNEYNGFGYIGGGDVADWDQQAVFGTSGGTPALTQTEINVWQHWAGTSRLRSRRPSLERLPAKRRRRRRRSSRSRM
jgi:hypothetical protein